MFLEKEFAGSAIRVALHDHGPIPQVRQQNGRDIGIILQEITLGDGFTGPKQLSQIGQMDRIAIDLKVRFRGVGRNFDRALAPRLRDSFGQRRQTTWVRHLNFDSKRVANSRSIFSFETIETFDEQTQKSMPFRIPAQVSGDSLSAICAFALNIINMSIW